MLFKLTLGNLRKSVRDYAVYFFTLVIGVAVFYVFNSIESQTAFLEISADTREIISLLISLLSGVSVFVAFVLGLLIVYASRFLMKRRNKEFALYLMLGMGKGRISAILFLETFVIGLVSLAAGIGVGIIASQFTSTFAANLFEANLSEYHFVVSASAITKTAVCFGILYLVVMLFNGIMVGKCKLFDLMQSGKKSENMKLKNPVLCVIIFILSALALAYAYYNVCYKTHSLSESNLMIMIAIGAVSTFFVFWSVSGMLLRVMMSAKSIYFRRLNSFTFRQLSSKINTMVMSMTMICLMLFVTICTLSSAFSMRNSLNDSINKYCPADYNTEVLGDDGCFDKLIHYNNDEFLSYFSEYVVFNEYIDDSVTIGNYLGDSLDAIKKDFPYLLTSANIPLYKISDYNKLMKLYGREELSLNDDSYAFVSNFFESTNFYNSVLKKGRTITINGKILSPMYDECQDGFVEISVQPMNDGLIVVPDNAVSECEVISHYLTGNYKVESKNDKIQTDEKLRDFLNYNANKCGVENMMYNTKIEMANSATGLGGLVIFLGMYIGIIFLISSGVILALRSLSDFVDSIQRYTMLRKIGVDESDISRSIFRQNLLFFAIPLLVAIIHSIFGMKFAMSYVLQIFGTDGMAKSVAGSGIIILLIYGGYFLITYLCSKSIVKNKIELQK